MNFYKQQQQQLETFMDLSQGNNTNLETDYGGGGGGACSSSTTTGSNSIIRKEHMFDKVVTPSDVGKLNRLVIPKQHAERYFPLDASSNDKGLLLNFEDRNGKAWRFRYSYWNSSQSYVMTKGWSRFVKEKKLDAGDIVSFHRGAGDSARHRLYIDWRSRPNAPHPTSFPCLDQQLHNPMRFSPTVRFGKLYSFPQSQLLPQFNTSIQHYDHRHPHDHHHYQHQVQAAGYGNVGSAPYNLRPSGGIQIGEVNVIHHHHHRHQGGDHHDHLPMVIESVPVVHGKTVGKRLRLFGVNMECPIQDDKSSSLPTPHLDSSSSIPLPPQVLRAPNSTDGDGAGAEMEAENSKKGKSISLSFDLDL